MEHDLKEEKEVTGPKILVPFSPGAELSGRRRLFKESHEALRWLDLSLPAP